jgi:hypothetical protein
VVASMRELVRALGNNGGSVFLPPVCAQGRRGGRKWRGSGRVLHFKLATTRHGGCRHGTWRPRGGHDLSQSATEAAARSEFRG